MHHKDNDLILSTSIIIQSIELEGMVGSLPRGFYETQCDIVCDLNVSKSVIVCSDRVDQLKPGANRRRRGRNSEIAILVKKIRRRWEKTGEFLFTFPNFWTLLPKVLYPSQLGVWYFF